MDLSALSEKEQIAMAIQLSMQYLDMEETDSSSSPTTATDSAHASLLPMHSE